MLTLTSGLLVICPKSWFSHTAGRLGRYPKQFHHAKYESVKLRLLVHLAWLSGASAYICALTQSVMILRAVGDIVSSMSLYSLGAPVVAS